MLVCKKCKSSDVDIQAWVNINTSEYTNDIGSNIPWCNNCNDDTSVIESEVA